MYSDYLHDCKDGLYEVGSDVYYIDKNGELRVGRVTRIRVEIDYKTLKNVNKVKVNYNNLEKVKKEIQDA